MTKRYTLWNAKDKRALLLPNKQMWQTTSKEEANQALHDLHDYLQAIGISHTRSQYLIMEVDQVAKMN